MTPAGGGFLGWVLGGQILVVVRYSCKHTTEESDMGDVEGL